MRVLVTRPAAQASEWVRHLRAAGLQAEALPLIDIAPAPDAAAVVLAWDALPTQAMVVFVSPNAATYFFAAKPAHATWPPAVVAASPGPGTTQVLRELSVPSIVEPAADAPQFDSEALWQQLSARDWAGQRVLVVRGTSGRDWLAERLRERGAELSFVAAYGRTAPCLSATQQALLDEALAQPATHLWFFSSSEAVAHLQALAPHADWARARAVATHPRIAESARRLGLGQVIEARPSLEDVVACIQSIAS
ncbi:MAG: uroporphyrinogen-III synthase [Cytophagales bacterium]|nr:uroporphyrinogen-III synthase [Rhizobacter sp.]